MKAILLGGTLLTAFILNGKCGVVEFDREGIEIKTNDAAAAKETVGEQEVIKARFEPTEKWAFVRIVPASGAWDLSKYSGVEVDITNDGGAPVKPGVRVDEAGKPPTAQAWNTAKVLSVDPGETKTILVEFGKDYGKPKDIDTSRIGAVHIFLGKGREEASPLIITGIRAVK